MLSFKRSRLRLHRVSRALLERRHKTLCARPSRTSDGFGITVSYWRDLESIRQWKSVSEHAAAQKMGRDAFYRSYRLRIARVEREYGFERGE